jgi:hypothetical protein
MVKRKHLFLPESIHRHAWDKNENFLSWRRLRRAADEGLSKSAVKGFYETQMTEAVLMAGGLLGSPARWDQHFRRAATSMTLSVLYGYPTLKSEQDRNVEAISDFTERLLKAVVMGAHPVQFFPWLRYLPSRWESSIHYHRDRLI